MKKLIATYRWVVYMTFSIVLLGCGAASESEMYDEPSSTVEESKQMAPAEEEMYEESATEKKDENFADVKKWKSKAKQQLESIQDLKLILMEPNLDADFKSEIEKELNLIYQYKDSNDYIVNLQELDFKNFKDLKMENEDTMSLVFKNKKDVLKAKFIVVLETKTFGESSEVIEQLKLLSITKEN
jgi:hypothetical protein